MFKRSHPNLDEVREKMMSLIQEALRIQMTPQRLMSEASKIITFDVAKLFDEANPRTSEKTVLEACQKLIGEEHFSSMPANDVDLYLQIVVRSAQRAIVSDLPTLTFTAATTGNNFYRGRFGAFMQKNQYEEAEKQAQKAFDCIKLWNKPNWRRMFALFALGAANYYQRKFDKSKQYFEAALAEYERLESYQQADEGVQHTLNQIKNIITRI